MSPRTLAPIAAIVGLVFGGFGVLAAGPLTGLFGLTLSETGLVVVRLACASYLGWGVLNAMARNLDDAAAWRAIAAGNGVGWGVGACVSILALMGVLGSLGATVADARVVLIPAMQVGFTALWTLAFLGAGRLETVGAPSAA